MPGAPKDFVGLRVARTFSRAVWLALVAMLGPAAGSAAASSISGLSASANSASAGATQVHYTIGFAATSAIPSATGFVQLTAPTGTVFSASGANYEVTDGTHLGYADRGVTVSPGGVGDNVVDVDIPSSFSVAANDTVEVDAYAVENPGSQNSNGTLSVSTSSDTTAVPTTFPIGPASGVTMVSASASSPSAGANLVAYKTSFTAANGITDGNPAD